MQTIIVSEPVLVTGSSIQEVREGLFSLKQFIKDGNSLIYLTNRPSDCMTPIGGYVNTNGNVSFAYKAKIKRNLGLEVLIEDEILFSEILKYNYAVFGNGAFIFDGNDRIVYEKYLEEETIKKVSEILKSYDYEENPDFFSLNMLKQPIIKYYKSNIGVLDKGDCSKIYGFQAYTAPDKRKSFSENEKLRQSLESSRLGLSVWILNNMLCIYNSLATKEYAINWLINNGLINPNDMRIVAGEETDLQLASQYPDLTYVVGTTEECFGNFRREESLMKVLESFF